MSDNKDNVPERIRIPIVWYKALCRINQIAKELNDYMSLGDEYILKSTADKEKKEIMDWHEATMDASEDLWKKRFEEILKPIRHVMNRDENYKEFLRGEMEFISYTFLPVEIKEFITAIEETLERNKT